MNNGLDIRYTVVIVLFALAAGFIGGWQFLGGFARVEAVTTLQEDLKRHDIIVYGVPARLDSIQRQLDTIHIDIRELRRLAEKPEPQLTLTPKK
jgi:hypothetical protein